MTSQAAGLADVLTPAAGIDKRVAAQAEAEVRHDRSAGDLLYLANFLELIPIANGCKMRYCVYMCTASAARCLRLAQRPACRPQPLLAAMPAPGLQQVRSLAQPQTPHSVLLCGAVLCCLPKPAHLSLLCCLPKPAHLPLLLFRLRQRLELTARTKMRRRHQLGPCRLPQPSSHRQQQALLPRLPPSRQRRPSRRQRPSRRSRISPRQQLRQMTRSASVLQTERWRLQQALRRHPGRLLLQCLGTWPLEMPRSLCPRSSAGQSTRLFWQAVSEGLMAATCVLGLATQPCVVTGLS